MKIWTKHRKRQSIGFYVGAYIAIVMSVIGFSGLFLSFAQKGPMNTGHETLKCGDCHREAPGTMRQQIQAKLQYVLNLRRTDATLGHFPVENKDCLSCHVRPDDPHPVFRFIEPRFADARKIIQPQHCISCHQEHRGLRITIEQDYCRHCHKSLSLKNDPLDVSHEQLIDEKKWNTCLACHDFHGNHLYTLPKTSSKMISDEAILNYFQGQDAPYSKEKRHRALKKEN